MTAIHRFNQWIVLGAAALHVIAIAYYRMRFDTDLVRPMLSGWMAVPRGMPTAQPAQRSTLGAAILLALAGAFVYWLVVIFPKG
jgi:hypothetical protein